ncbi:MAG: DUF819 family protein [Cytophagales bacterium]|nr:DUF819 family protein [Cytophagales bacterium]
MSIALALFYFLFPVFIIYLTQKSNFLKKVGAVVLAYASGLVLGNIGIFPRASAEFREILKNETAIPVAEARLLYNEGVIHAADVTANKIAAIQNNIISAAILLAIPLLLFSLDFKKWLRLTKEALFSLLLAMISLLAAVFSGYYFFKDLIDESWKVTGLLIGLYSGGTPNLAAIGTALNVGANTFILTHTYDMVVGAICLLFLMTIAQPLFNRFLPSFNLKHENLSDEIGVEHNEDIDSFMKLLSKYGIIEILKGFGFSSVIVAISGGLSTLVPQGVQMVTVILSITTLGLLFSNWKVVNKIENSFQLGMYFIIVFSLVVASMGDLRSMFQIEYLHLFSFVSVVVLGSMAIHLFLSYLFKVDTDTTIITITALTYSPPFVPVVAGALRNRTIIISGLTVGILGYAIGNYLGLAIAYFLE